MGTVNPSNDDIKYESLPQPKADGIREGERLRGQSGCILSKET
jgi:hypothetical protein